MAQPARITPIGSPLNNNNASSGRKVAGRSRGREGTDEQADTTRDVLMGRLTRLANETDPSGFLCAEWEHLLSSADLPQMIMQAVAPYVYRPSFPVAARMAEHFLEKEVPREVVALACVKTRDAGLRGNPSAYLRKAAFGIVADLQRGSGAAPSTVGGHNVQRREGGITYFRG